MTFGLTKEIAERITVDPVVTVSKFVIKGTRLGKMAAYRAMPII
jgi:hypothetical protein